MFEPSSPRQTGPSCGVADDAYTPLTSGDVAAFTASLRHLDEHVDDAERIQQLRLLEELKSAAAAAQARVTAAFAASQRRKQTAAGERDRSGRISRGIGAQVGLARRESPVKGAQHLGLATTLVCEMPHTLAALEAGEISEWRATILARETACLSREHRAEIDAGLADKLSSLGDQQLVREARALAYRLEPTSVMARVRGAEADRRVTIRPAPDTMTLLTGFLPVAQGVAAYAALSRQADAMKAQGDPRGRGQIMADEFVRRLTGQSTAEAVPVEVGVVMTDRALLDDDVTPARIEGIGPIPAALARALVRDTEAEVWVRRLYRDPAADCLAALDSTRRIFPAGLRRFLVLRDQFCRTPFCGAAIRHADHVVRSSDGGATTAANGQGLCVTCNLAKEASGWSARADRDGTIAVTTPTLHTYTSRPPPPLPGARWPARLHGHSSPASVI